MSTERGAVVSAILPLKHYHPEYLAAAINSMLAQTNPDWRLVIIVEQEDVARFRTVLAPWLPDTRVALVPNDRRGYVAAFNTGMRAAETPFVGILLGDDMWDPSAVSVLSEAIGAHPDVDLFHSGRRVVDEQGQAVSGVYLPEPTVHADDFIWKSPIKHLICWRRELGLSIGGMDERITTAGPDDYDFPWLLVERGAVVHAINECLYVYRDHRDAFRHTTHIPRSHHLRNLRYILRKHGVSRLQTWRKLRHAKKGYLRQCLYRNDLHRRALLYLGHDARRGWREQHE